VVLNLLLFIPFAVGLRLTGARGLITVGVCAGLSLLIESLQFTLIVGRDASLSDLLTNTLGSLVGSIIGGQARQLLFPTAKQAVRLMTSAAIIWLGAQTATAVLLLPWAPSAGLAGAWARSVPGRVPFDGSVASAVVSGLVVPDGSNARSPELAARIRQGDIRLHVGVRTGTNAAVWSPVFELLGTSGAVLSIEAVNRHLAFQPPMQSYRLRLRRPALRLPDALPSQTGTLVQITAGERDGTVWARWTVAGLSHTTSQVLGPSLGWTLITPMRHSLGPEAHWITALWIGAWLAPIGYWSARTGRSHSGRAGILLLVLVIGLGLLPHLLGYPPVHWSEWLSGMVGVGLGYTGHRSAAYFR
jgi:hypothetical protein